MGRLVGVGALVGAVWALLGAAATASQEDPVHLFSEVFVCQPDSPSASLLQTLDDQQLFWFNFLGTHWQPRLPSFQPEVQNRTPVEKIESHSKICSSILDALTNFSDTYIFMPETKGVPQVDVFTLYPLQLGRPNTLVCSVTNTFPPSANITWEHHNQTVVQGVSTTQISPVQGLEFQIFSYLEVTPQKGDVYSCIVRAPRDDFSYVGFWVPKDPIPSELLENIICGIAFGVGLLSAVAGVVLIMRARRRRWSS